jgi:hypothetical protein
MAARKLDTASFGVAAGCTDHDVPSQTSAISAVAPELAL